MSDKKEINILFVCIGNICRSPMAEAIFQNIIVSNQLESKVYCDSAGIGGWHEGEAADHRTIKVAKYYNLNVIHKARQIKPKDLFHFEYILNMEESVHHHVQQLKQSRKNTISQLFLFREFDYGYQEKDVPDPYVEREEAFYEMYKILDRSSQNFFAYLQENHSL